MITGTIALVEPQDEPLESWYHDDETHLPALQVEDTQTSFDDRPVQTGIAAGYDDTTRQSVSISIDPDGNPSGITVNREDDRKRIATEWVADVTGSGLVAIESVAGDGEFDFPLDLFYTRLGLQPERQFIDVEELYVAWDREDVLGDIWLAAGEDMQGTSIDYHGNADGETLPSIGLGFERPWGGTVMEGVVYASGYVAVYNTTHASQFVRFVEEELLPYRYTEESAQQRLLGDSEDEEDEACERCGRESDSIEDGLCIVCRDAEDDPMAGED